MSSKEMHRLLQLCNIIEKNGEIGEFELRHTMGISHSLYSQVKSDLLHASAFKWRVEFNKRTKTWKYIGGIAEAEARRKADEKRKEGD